MSLATLSIDIEARLANFERDLSKVADRADEFASKMTGAFKGVGLAAAGLAGVGSFAILKGNIEDAISSMAGLKDAAERTGASVENLSALKGVAKIGGRDFEAIEGALDKMNKALHSTDDESKGAGKALAALGLNLQELRNLDPAQAMLEVAKAQEQFADGSGKAAAMMAIFGKSGAQLIPFLKDLAEQSTLVGKVTKEQAAAADEYEKNVKRLTASWGTLSKQMAAAVVGPAKDITDWMLKAQKEGGTLQAVLVGIGAALSKAMGQEINPLKISEADSTAAFNRVLSIKAQIDKVTAELDSGKLTFLGEDAAKRRIENLKQELSGAERELKKSTARLKQLAAEQVEKDKPLSGELNSQTFGADKKEKNDPHANDYSNIISQLNEKIAVQTADLNSVEKLTQAEKDYAKFQADIASGTIVLTDSQKKVAESYYAVYLARNKANEAEKSQKKIDNIISDYERSNAIVVDRINREKELALMTERERDIAQALYKVEDEGRSIRERIIRDVTDETEQTAALSRANEELLKQKQRVAEETAKSYDDRKSFEFGWTKAFQEYSDQANNAANKAKEVFNKSTQAMEDAMVSFAMTGKISFSNLANSIIADIIRMQAKSATSGLMGFLGSAFEGFFGGGSSSSGGNTTPGFSSGDLGSGIRINANGGVYNSPSLSAYSGGVYNTPQLFKFASGAGVFAEAGPEAIMPLKRGPDGKLGVSSDGSGSVTVNVYNESGSSARTERRSDGRGGSVIDVFIEQVKGAIAGDIASGNGAVPSAMERTYGMRRMAGAY